MCHSAQTGQWTPSLSGPGPDSGSSAVRDSGEAGPGTQVSTSHGHQETGRHGLIPHKLNLGELIYNFEVLSSQEKKVSLKRKQDFSKDSGEFLCNIK